MTEYNKRAVLYNPEKNLQNKEKAKIIMNALKEAHNSLSAVYQSAKNKDLLSLHLGKDPKPIEFSDGTRSILLYSLPQYEFDNFPIIPGKTSWYHKHNSNAFEVNFGDVIYVVSKEAAHYLSDEDSLGWSWLPSDDFMNRILKGGYKNTYSKAEEYCLQKEKIGFLCKRINEKGESEFFDYENKVPARLGKAPEEFRYSFHQVRVIFGANDILGRSTTIPPNPDYADLAIEKHQKKSLCSYVGHSIHQFFSSACNRTKVANDEKEEMALHEAKRMI